MKNKVLSVLIVFMMCLGLAGCGGGSNSASDDISGCLLYTSRCV